jgi:hypothetical protein
MRDDPIIIQQWSNIKTKEERKWRLMFIDAPTYDSIKDTQSVGQVIRPSSPQHEDTGEYKAISFFDRS